jgi:hypothetical protein
MPFTELTALLKWEKRVLFVAPVQALIETGEYSGTGDAN